MNVSHLSEKATACLGKTVYNIFFWKQESFL